MRAFLGSLLCFVAAISGRAEVEPKPVPAPPAPAAAPADPVEAEPAVEVEVSPRAVFEFLALASGIAIGISGIYQKMQDKEVQRLRQRYDEVLRTLNDSDTQLLKVKREDAVKVYDLEAKVAMLEKLVERSRCPWTKPNGSARCEGETAPVPAQPGETFPALPSPG